MSSATSSSSSSSSRSVYYAQLVGDVSRAVVVAIALHYAYSVVGNYYYSYSADNNNNNNSVFDEQWMKDGFCVKNPGVDYWTSHDVCLYVDSVFAILVWAVQNRFRKEPGLEYENEIMKRSYPGILLHGIVHGLVAYQLRKQRQQASDEEQQQMLKTSYELVKEQPLLATLLYQVPIWLFWYSLLRSVMVHQGNSSKVQYAAACLAHAGGIFVPTQLAFTYVQTVLVAAGAADDVAASGKEKEDSPFAYATAPLMVGFPIVMAAWAEATLCTRFVRDYFYGHVLFDATIPASQLVWYFTCYYYGHRKRNSYENKTSLAAAAKKAA